MSVSEWIDLTCAVVVLIASVVTSVCSRQTARFVAETMAITADTERTESAKAKAA